MSEKSKSKIEIDVELDENKVPEKLVWSASDGGISNKEAKALLLSVWDLETKKHSANGFMDKRYASSRNESLLLSIISFNG